MKDDENLDDLLKQALSVTEVPSAKLNAELKYKMINEIEEKRSISIWWLPMMISIYMSGMGYILIKIFVFPGVIQDLLILWGMIAAVFNFIITVAGIRYFDLRKGARINI